MNTRGTFIVIEGDDGAGKTSIMQALYERYGTGVHFTREPGGTPFAESLREAAVAHKTAKDVDGIAQFLLMWSARRDHVVQAIEPKLRSGIHVVSDRFDASSWAYNIRGQEAGHLEILWENVREMVLGSTKPDLYIWLNVDPKIGVARRQHDGQSSHFDERNLAFHERVRQGYQEFTTRYPSKVIDANQPFESVLQEVLDTVAPKLG